MILFNDGKTVSTTTELMRHIQKEKQNRRVKVRKQGQLEYLYDQPQNERIKRSRKKNCMLNQY
jgi:hypothetical protein